MLKTLYLKALSCYTTIHQCMCTCGRGDAEPHHRTLSHNFAHLFGCTAALRPINLNFHHFSFYDLRLFFDTHTNGLAKCLQACDCAGGQATKIHGGFIAKFPP
eukprot:GHRR01031516.1.p1 GENE.GHRR01031516.1~~GHRR01031516.1.p1  ORF type:complete len:103 (+),score=7.08 GHRR01031516.1:137-445(+)